MARNIYGLDLGTYEIKVYDKKQDSTWKEKNVIAIVSGLEKSRSSLAESWDILLESSQRHKI